MHHQNPYDLAVLEHELAQYLTRAQAARILGVSTARVGQLLKTYNSGKPLGLPHIRTGYGALIPRWAVENRLNGVPMPAVGWEDE